MAKCLPGMPCYNIENLVVYTYPKGCTTCSPVPCTFPISSDYLAYTGPNLPNTGIQTDMLFTEALQRIDDIINGDGDDVTWGGVGGIVTNQTDLIAYLIANYSQPGDNISDFVNDAGYVTSGGIINTAAANEMMKSDATNAVPSGLFSTTAGNLTLGTGLAGTTRTFTAAGTALDVGLVFTTKGTGALAFIAGNAVFTLPNGFSVTSTASGASFIMAGGLTTSVPAASTDSVLGALVVNRTTTGTPSPGIGVSILFSVETSVGNNELGATIEALTTAVSGGTENFDLLFKTMTLGATATEKLRISSAGAIGIGGANYGTAGQVMTSGGSAAAPTWTTISGLTDGNKGDITVTASGVTWTINNDAVSYAKIQNVSATNRILGRITAGAGDIEELTGTQATTLLNNFTDTLKGLVPLSGGGTTNFLRADGTWAPPGGVGGITNTAAANELMKSDGTNAVTSGVFVGGALGNVQLGTGLTGANRSVFADGTATDVAFILAAKGAGHLTLQNVAGLTGFVGVGIGTPDRMLDVSSEDANNSSVSYLLQISHTTSGIPGVGIGVGMEFSVETLEGMQTGAVIEAIATNVTSDTQDFDLVFKTQSAGAAASEKLRITSDGRLYGTALHNNAGDITGATNQYIASGTYTPTLTPITNISATTAHVCQWMRVGNVVTVSGRLSADPVVDATSTQVDISLPIPSTFTDSIQLAGTAGSTGGVTQGILFSNVASDEAGFEFLSTGSVNDTFYFTFTYLIL